MSPHKLAATTLADWHALMAMNLDAALLLTRAFVPAMKQAGWGRLVIITSDARRVSIAEGDGAIGTAEIASGTAAGAWSSPTARFRHGWP